MPLPNFLIIGAMKSGTTTLYRDLLTHPGVYLPVDKEVHALIDPDVLTDEGRAAYEKHFEAASPGQILGEASTGYSKRPTHEGVAERAKALLGPDLRVVYIIREPISRSLSQHYHTFSWGEVAGDADRVIRENNTFIDYSRYAYQLEPWLREFGRDRVRVIKFEDYVRNRESQLADLCVFLGIDPEGIEPEVDTVFNKGDNRPIHTGVLSTINRSGLYRKVLRNVIPPSFRQFLYRTVFPKAPDRPLPPSADTLGMMKERISQDLSRLPELLGDSAPSWDLDASIAKALGRPAPAGEAAPEPAGQQNDPQTATGARA